MSELVYDVAAQDVVPLDYAKQRIVLAWTHGLTARDWERVALHLRECGRRCGNQDRCPGHVSRGCDCEVI
jgi:hypothetical protein